MSMFGPFGPLGYGAIGETFSSYTSAQEAARATEAARSAEEHTRQIEARLDRLLLVTQAMWDLLRDKSGLDEQTLLDQVNLRAQRKTEKLQSPDAAKCPQCGRPMGPKAAKCIYCGATRPIENVFDAV